MGGCQSHQLQYSVPISEPKSNESAIYRKPGYENNNYITVPKNGCKTVQESFLKICEQYPNKNALGTLKKDGTYKYKTFQQFKDISTYIGSGILNLNLIPKVVKYEDREGHKLDLKMIGIHAKNREEWVTTDMANVLYGNTMVPLYDTLGPDTIGYVLKHSGITTCFCQSSTITTLLQSRELGALENIVTFDEIDQQQQQLAKQRKLKLLTLESVIESGKQRPRKYFDITPNHCYSFSYTSGTTGNPKGAMISHKNIMSATAAGELTDIQFTPEDVHLSYLPLPHLYERLIMINVIHYGATMCFYSGDMLKLKDDLAACKPTLFFSVPRLYNKFYQGINAKFSETSGIKSGLVQMGLNSKLSNVQQGAGHTHKLWDGLVFKKTKELLGGRCRSMVSGSAPLSEDVINFMKVAMSCPLLQGYALTESTAAGFVTNQDDHISGHVGGPVANIEFKLKDVKDMNYTSKDTNENGEITPRGEILYRGPSIFQGYYLDPEKTQESVDKDGWLHTGDIGMINPNGSLKIIDRKKNIFKLSQGEYVAPEKIENIYVRAKGVEQVFLHGDSFQSYCIAVIFPNESVFTNIAQINNIQGNFEELCNSQHMNKIMLKYITDLGKSEGLHGFEQAKKIILIPKSFLEIDCMTNTMKLQRTQAKNYFKEQLEKLYKEPL